MKVFISWSGPASNRVAQALRDWLPAVLQATRPYYSPDDIAKGARWNQEVSRELEESRIGILCMTRDNLNAPWIMFEAGALAKSLDRSHVIPLLVGIEPTDLGGPLAQFQAARIDHEDMFRTVSVINQQLGASALEEGVLVSVFEKWWPDLESRINAISTTQQTLSVPRRSERDLLEEILSLLRERAFSVGRTQSREGTSIELLDLTVRVVNCLKADGIETIEQLVKLSENDLLRVQNLGRRAISEIKAALQPLGANLAPLPPTKSDA